MSTSVKSTHGARRVTPAPSASATIILDPPLNREIFAPPGDAQPKLTAEEAIAAYEAVNVEFELPADSTAQLGLYTAAVGDGTYRYQERLAWGVSWHQCAQAIGGDIGPPPTPDLSACTAWLFLDANTGVMFEATWQRDG